MPKKFAPVRLMLRSVLLEQLGHVNYKVGNYKKALQFYTQDLDLLMMLSFNSERPRIQEILSSAYYNRGNTYDELGEYDKAIEDYDHALALPNPEPWNVLLNRALVYEKLGQFDKAEQDVLQAHQRAPNCLPNIERSLARIQIERMMT